VLEQLPQRAGQVRIVAAERQIERQIDHAAGRTGPASLGLDQVVGVADEGPAADLAPDQPPPLRLGIGPRHGPDGHAEAAGQIAVGGELLTGSQPAPGEILTQGIGDGLVPGAGAASEIGLPDCHGDNMIIVSIDLVKVECERAFPRPGRWPPPRCGWTWTHTTG